MQIAITILPLLIVTASLSATEAVVLLHGLTRSNDSMEEMGEALSESGFLVLNVDYPSRTATIQDLSDQVMAKVMENPRLQDCSKVHFVTHSLGGILVRDYFADHTLTNLGHVVMLGPPNQGSEVVDQIGDWWLFKKINGPAGNELGTDSDSTPNQLGPVDFDLGVIAGNRSINWINSLMIEGPDDGKVSVEFTKVEGMNEHLILPTTHPFMMKNDEVIEATIRYLKTGSFDPVEE